MSRVCSVCQKGQMSGNNVSHSNRKSKRTWSANVQKVTVKEGNSTAKKYVCTKCLKSGKVERV